MPELQFQFGKNWLNFLNLVDEKRIHASETSMRDLLGVGDLKGKTFLDVGSGSGLHSLSAHRLGATVRSFDYDPSSVACTQEMKKRFSQNGAPWIIERGSALDTAYLQSLGQFDIVYSWGVLHHTGSMWQALANVIPLVKPGGILAIAIYNDQGGASRRWTFLKRLYNRSPKPGKLILVLGAGLFFETRSAIARLIKGENPLPFKQWRLKRQDRGMSVWHDLVDWMGGYPFEVAKPEEIFDFYKKRSFTLLNLKTAGGGFGCNEYVFQKT